MGAKYTIGTLAGLTGLSAHTIRAWERRHGALSPDRTDTNRRVYADQDVERLSLLRKLVEAGHSIGQVAHLPTEQLRTLESARGLKGRAIYRIHGDDPHSFVIACLKDLGGLDPEGLEENLVRGAAALGILGLLNGVVIPLLAEIEAGWLDGSVPISHEHMASAVLRTYLDRVRMSISGPPNGPRLLVTTPSNQHHEIGALMVSIFAAMQSWRVTYLGPNLPATEIARAARNCGAHAIGLSIVFPTDDDVMPGELRLLRRELGPSTPILVGGRAAGSYESILEEIGAEICNDLADLREPLDRIARKSMATF
jgi:DNA-binding transcriptional MerR regulator/methylmalonyl-CoA mutase cobalamin-binding subunit